MYGCLLGGKKGKKTVSAAESGTMDCALLSCLPRGRLILWGGGRENGQERGEPNHQIAIPFTHIYPTNIGPFVFLGDLQ